MEDIEERDKARGKRIEEEKERMRKKEDRRMLRPQKSLAEMANRGGGKRKASDKRAMLNCAQCWASEDARRAGKEKTKTDE